MKVTAIIAFTLIGLLFLLKECGNSALEKKTRHEASSTYQLAEITDKSYRDRDKEIALASYNKKDAEQETVTVTSHHTEVEQPTVHVSESKQEVVEVTQVEEITQALPKIPKPTEVPTVPTPIHATATVEVNQTLPATPKPTDVSEIIPTPVKAIETPSEVEEPISMDEVNVNDTAEDLIVYQAISEPIKTETTVDVEKMELERTVEEQSREAQIAQREIADLRKKRDALEKEITDNLRKQEVLYEQYTAQQEQSDRELKNLNANYKRLEGHLTVEIKKQTTIKEKNDQLQAEIEKILAIAKEGTAKATQEQKQQAQEFQRLNANYQEMESNLTAQQEKAQQLNEENFELQSQIAELTKTKEALNLHYLAQIEKIKELEALAVEYTNQKANLAAKIEEKEATNTQLQSEINKLVNMGQEIADKATLEQKEKNQQIDALTLTSRQLEENLTAQIATQSTLQEENSQLKSEIEKMLAIAKEGTEKAVKEQEARAKEFEVLQLKLHTTEANLTAQSDQNRQLKSEMANLLSMGQEMADKATLEQQEKNMQIEALHLKTKNLESNLSAEIAKQDTLNEKNTELQSKIEKMLSIAKEETEKATKEQEARTKEFDALQSKFKNLEVNLTTEVEKQKALKEKNIQLETQVTNLETEKERLTQQATAQEKSLQELATLQDKNKTLEANLSSGIEIQKNLNEKK